MVNNKQKVLRFGEKACAVNYWEQEVARRLSTGKKGTKQSALTFWPKKCEVCSDVALLLCSRFSRRRTALSPPRYPAAAKKDGKSR